MAKKTTYSQKRGRENGKQEPFVMIYLHVLRHDKFKALSGNARAGLIALCELHDGTNNGDIVLSSREAAKVMGLYRDTAARVLKELAQKGFLVVTQDSSFGQKRLARAYAITLYPYKGRQPTYAFKRNNSPEFSLKTCWRPKPSKGKNGNVIRFEAPEEPYNENAVETIK